MAQVVSKLLGVMEVLHIDVGVGWGHLAVVGLTHYNGHNFLVHAPKELLSHILLTQRVLKGQIELVIRFQGNITGVGLVHIGALDLSTATHNVNLWEEKKIEAKTLSLSKCRT